MVTRRFAASYLRQSERVENGEVSRSALGIAYAGQARLSERYGQPKTGRKALTLAGFTAVDDPAQDVRIA